MEPTDDKKQKPKKTPKRKESTDIYFDVHRKFIPKILADELLKEYSIFTLQDSKKIGVYINGVFRVDTGQDIVETLTLNKLKNHFTKSRIAEVVAYIKMSTLINNDKLNPDPLLINIKNGMYDVSNDKLLPHDPKFKSTVQLNVSYNPNVECPLINKFLHEVVSQQDVLVLLQYIGYSCTLDITQQRALMVEGPMQNGKSTFIDLVCHLVGQENVAQQSIQSLNSDRFARAQLNGKIINMFSDLPQKKIYDNSVFKMLTTDAWIDGDEKFTPKFRFKNTIHQIYSANKLPDVEDPDEMAFFRRWIIITFPNSFSDRADKGLLKKLTIPDEISGLFNIAMVGLRALFKFDKFCYAPSVADNRKTYLSKSNPITTFLEECVYYSEYDCEKKELYDVFEEWCEFNKITSAPSITKFGKTLHKDLDYDSGRAPKGEPRPYVWKNIGYIRPWSVHGSDEPQTKSKMSTGSDKSHSRLPVYSIEYYKRTYNDLYVNILLIEPTIDDRRNKKKQQQDTPNPPSIVNSTIDTNIDETTDRQMNQEEIIELLKIYRINNFPFNNRPDINDFIETKQTFVKGLSKDAKISKESSLRYVNDAFRAWDWA